MIIINTKNTWSRRAARGESFWGKWENVKSKPKDWLWLEYSHFDRGTTNCTDSLNNIFGKDMHFINRNRKNKQQPAPAEKEKVRDLNNVLSKDSCKIYSATFTVYTHSKNERKERRKSKAEKILQNSNKNKEIWHWRRVFFTFPSIFFCKYEQYLFTKLTLRFYLEDLSIFPPLRNITCDTGRIIFWCDNLRKAHFISYFPIILKSIEVHGNEKLEYMIK